MAEYVWWMRKVLQSMKIHAKCSKHSKKRSRIIKYIKSISWCEWYHADTVELDSRIAEDDKYPYLLTIFDHFSKYGFACPIKDKNRDN